MPNVAIGPSAPWWARHAVACCRYPAARSLDRAGTVRPDRPAGFRFRRWPTHCGRWDFGGPAHEHAEYRVHLRLTPKRPADVMCYAESLMTRYQPACLDTTQIRVPFGAPGFAEATAFRRCFALASFGAISRRTSRQFGLASPPSAAQGTRLGPMPRGADWRRIQPTTTGILRELRAISFQCAGKSVSEKPQPNAFTGRPGRSRPDRTSAYVGGQVEAEVGLSRQPARGTSDAHVGTGWLASMGACSTSTLVKTVSKYAAGRMPVRPQGFDVLGGGKAEAKLNRRSRTRGV